SANTISIHSIAAMPLSPNAASGDFSETDNCGTSLAPLASCTIIVTFTPTAASVRNGAVTMTDNAVASPQIISLTGIGINSPIITLAPPSLIFSSRLVSSASPALASVLTNSGTANLDITSVAVTGTNSGDFTQTNNCGSTVVPGANCTISVIFDPTAGGLRTAGVTINSDARGSIPVLTLTGTGIAPGIDLSTNLLI